MTMHNFTQEIPGAPRKVGQYIGDTNQPPILDKVEGDVEGVEVAVLVGAHCTCKPLEEFPSHSCT